MSKKLRVFYLVLASTMAMQGCSTTSEISSTQELATIDLLSESTNESTAETTSETSALEVEHHMDIEVNEEEHTFVIHADNDVLDEDLYGVIPTSNYPETANVYVKIDEEHEYSPISCINDWNLVLFQYARLLTQDLSSDESASYIDSLTRIATSDFEQISVFETAFPDVEFANYVIRHTYPPVTTGLYNLIDIESTSQTSADVVKNRGLDVYTVRQAIDGIPFELPYEMDTPYHDYDFDNEIWSFVGNYVEYYDYCLYYDGYSIYETNINRDGVSGTYIEDSPILTLEEAFELANPAIYKVLSYCKRYSAFNIHFYEAELVYLPIRQVEVTNEEFQRNPFWVEGGETYLYPCWAIYYHYNTYLQGYISADHCVLLVNAIDGDVYGDIWLH